MSEQLLVIGWYIAPRTIPVPVLPFPRQTMPGRQEQKEWGRLFGATSLKFQIELARYTQALFVGGGDI